MITLNSAAYRRKVCRMANTFLRLIVVTLAGAGLATTALAQSHSAKPKPPVDAKPVEH